MYKKLNLLYTISSVLLILSSAAYFFNIMYAEFVFTVAVAALLVHKLIQNKTDVKSDDFRKKRLVRLEFYSLAVLILAAYSMITDKNYWIPLLLIYALVVIFLSYRTKD